MNNTQTPGKPSQEKFHNLTKLRNRASTGVLATSIHWIGRLQTSRSGNTTPGPMFDNYRCVAKPDSTVPRKVSGVLWIPVDRIEKLRKGWGGKRKKRRNNRKLNKK